MIIIIKLIIYLGFFFLFKGARGAKTGGGIEGGTEGGVKGGGRGVNRHFCFFAAQVSTSFKPH